MKYLHITMFICSIAGMFITRHDALWSMVIAELVTLYVVIFNLSKPEILPPLTFVVIFKIIEYPIALSLYGESLIEQLIYIGFIMAADILLVIAILSYRNPFVRRVFRVNTPNLRIPQINALATLLALGVLHAFLVGSELGLYYFDFLDAQHVPFFYRTFPEVRATLKVLMLLSVWSMMLDAYFHPVRLNRPVN